MTKHQREEWFKKVADDDNARKRCVARRLGLNVAKRPTGPMELWPYDIERALAALLLRCGTERAIRILRSMPEAWEDER